MNPNNPNFKPERPSKKRLEEIRESVSSQRCAWPGTLIKECLIEIDVLTEELFILKTEHDVELARLSMVQGIQNIAIENSKLREQNRIMEKALEYIARNEALVDDRTYCWHADEALVSMDEQLEFVRTEEG